MNDAVKRPAHPGSLIREDVLPAYGLSVSATARLLNVNRANLHGVLSGDVAMTPDMAIKLEAAFGVSADLLLRMQAAFDLAEARDREAAITAGITRQTLAA